MKKEKIFWGLFFIAAAAFLLCSQMGFIVGINAWTIVFSVFLAICLIKSLVSLSWFGIFFSLALFAILYSDELNINAITPWPVLLAALLLTIGFSMIFTKKRIHKHKSRFDDSFSDVENSSEDNITFDTQFGSSVKYLNSSNFKKANVYSNFAGMKIYLDNVQIEDEAILNFDLSFAGVELYIPKKYRVKNEVKCFLGGIDEKNYHEMSTTETIVLTGNLKFSGITITYI